MNRARLTRLSIQTGKPIVWFDAHDRRYRVAYNPLLDHLDSVYAAFRLSRRLNASLAVQDACRVMHHPV